MYIVYKLEKIENTKTHRGQLTIKTQFKYRTNVKNILCVGFYQEEMQHGA